MRFVTALFLTTAMASAAGPELDSLIAQATAAPGELGAEALLRLASLESLPKAQRVELAEQAFQHAPAAQNPYKRRATLVRSEGAAQLLNKMYAQNWDALSLRLRAVETMLPLDGAKAREWFARIPEVRLPRLTCEDFLVYDPSQLYAVLETVSAAEPGNAERTRLLDRYAGAVTSPVQVAGMARALAAADVDDAEFQTLLRKFISALLTIRGDDRSFTWSRGIGRQIGALSAKAQERKISPLPLLESYRVYLVYNLSGARCADSELMQGGNLQAFAMRTPEDSDPEAAEFASQFNQKLLIPPLQPIKELEVMPSKLGGVSGGRRACEDPECQGFVKRYRELLAEPRDSPEWTAKMVEAAAALDQWTSGTHTGPAQFFMEKASAFSELLNLAGNGPARGPVIQRLIAFLEKSSAQQSDRAAWLLSVSALTGRATLDPLGFGIYAEQMRKSGNRIIALYGNLEAAAPRPADRILPLL